MPATKTSDPIGGSGAVLTATQSKLLLAMYVIGRPVYTKEFLEFTGVPHSTWSDSLRLFLKTGLLSKESRREESEGRIKSFALFALTEKGKRVGNNLEAISRALIEDEVKREQEDENRGMARFSDRVGRQAEVDGQILRCVEKGLETFGARAKNAVRIELALRNNISWSDVPRRMREVSNCLRDRFGPRGASSIEATILRELDACFGRPSDSSMRERDSECLASFIEGLRGPIVSEVDSFLS